MFLGEMLMGMDLEGDEPGEVSKCIVCEWCTGWVSSVYVYSTLAGTVGREGFLRNLCRF